MTILYSKDKTTRQDRLKWKKMSKEDKEKVYAALTRIFGKDESDKK